MTTGCGDPELKAHPASGRVVFEDGSPVHVGSIEIRSKVHGVQARGEIESDGSFRLSTYRPKDGAIAGVHDVVIVQFINAEQTGQHVHGSLGIVHSKYASYATSPLTCVIPKGGVDDLEISVTGIDSE